MNIFAISDDYVECAQALDDLRLNKMILETAQLLSTALRQHGYIGDDVYKSTHVNHPCSVWARENRSNYRWLYNYFAHLCAEKYDRSGKIHKSYDLAKHFSFNMSSIPIGDKTPFANCTPYKGIETFEAYKQTLKDKWAKDKRPPTWGHRGKPSWA